MGLFKKKQVEIKESIEEKKIRMEKELETLKLEVEKEREIFKLHNEKRDQLRELINIKRGYDEMTPKGPIASYIAQVGRGAKIMLAKIGKGSKAHLEKNGQNMIDGTNAFLGDANNGKEKNGYANKKRKS